MKTSTLAIAAVVLHLALPSWASAQIGGDAQSAPPAIRQLFQEVAKLRRDLHLLQIEHGRLKIASLERELQLAQTQRLRAETEWALLKQEIDELDEQMKGPNLDSKTYARLLNTRNELAQNRMVNRITEQQVGARWEAETTHRISLERHQLQELIKAIGK